MMIHDWVFVSISINWTSGEAKLMLIDSESMSRELLFEKIIECTLTRFESWGPSVSINEYSSRLTADNILLTEIEMQSGDKVIIKSINKPFLNNENKAR